MFINMFGQAHLGDQFEESGMSRERFDSSLKKLEEAVNVNMSDHNSSSSVSSRQSISALFLSRSNLPGQSRFGVFYATKSLTAICVLF